MTATAVQALLAQTVMRVTAITAQTLLTQTVMRVTAITAQALQAQAVIRVTAITAQALLAQAVMRVTAIAAQALQVQTVVLAVQAVVTAAMATSTLMLIITININTFLHIILSRALKSSAFIFSPYLYFSGQNAGRPEDYTSDTAKNYQTGNGFPETYFKEEIYNENSTQYSSVKRTQKFIKQ